VFLSGRGMCDHCPMIAPRLIALLAMLALLPMGGCGREPGSDAPAPAKVLRRGNGGDPGSLDPALAHDEHAFNVLADLYEGLVVLGPGGTIRPGVAESWEISDDGLVYTFRLRDDARWSNGERVTAGHFVHAFERVAAAETAAPLSFLLEPVAAVDATDDHTFVIALASPAPHFLSVLTMSIAMPAWPGEAKQTVSNGPFVLDTWRPGEILRLRRNPDFHAADTIALDLVEYYPIADPATEFTRYRAGELDVTATVPPASLDRIREERPAELRIAPRLAVYYLALDLTEAPFDDVGLRHALSMAVDRDTLTRIIGRGEQPAFGFVPGGIAGYVPARYAWADMSHQDRIDEARRLFADAGYDRSLRLTLMYDVGDIHEQVALAIGSMWRDVFGIEVDLDKREWQYFLDSRSKRGEWDLMRFAWTGDYSYPTAFLELFLSGNPMNLPGYANPAFDRLVGQGRFAEAEALMLADYPVIPLYFYVSKHLVSPAVRGFEDNPLDIHPSRYLSL